jgi:predicted Rossmann fold nucleotide-binding protein DprA/Smf involved in DNA uptake
MEMVYLNQGEPDYPMGLNMYLTDRAPARVAALGNLDILKEKKTAFLCSSKCPGELIIKTHDLARKWRDDGVTIIGGFHSPMELECLTILLRGKQPVILCPARSLDTMRIKAKHKTPVTEGRLLIISPFPAKEKRMTAETAIIRNRFVAALADGIFVAHAAEGGKIEAFCCELAARGRSIMTLESDANANLAALGAQILHL